LIDVVAHQHILYPRFTAIPQILCRSQCNTQNGQNDKNGTSHTCEHGKTAHGKTDFLREITNSPTKAGDVTTESEVPSRRRTHKNDGKIARNIESTTKRHVREADFYGLAGVDDATGRPIPVQAAWAHSSNGSSNSTTLTNATQIETIQACNSATGKNDCKQTLLC
jgi:hypothetical protein